MTMYGRFAIFIVGNLSITCSQLAGVSLLMGRGFCRRLGLVNYTPLQSNVLEPMVCSHDNLFFFFQLPFYLYTI
ncbi:hypothetical protein HanPSC8_Chr07g0288461 [Helianthus annuus]|nr:hypothetical protein HanPSC8_Chr07g0288461 [Helianthus annuus]